jgi:hypothetical protein
MNQDGAQTDDDHLRLLAIFHYVVGGLGALFAFFPLIHLTLGLFLLWAPVHPGQGTPPPAFVAWLFIFLGGMLFLAGETMAVCVLAAGAFIRRRTHYWFVFVVACVQCMFIPFGTILGVFTIIVLSRPAVKHQFGIAH